MLVVVSDLHLQHTAADHIHYRDGRALRRTGVRRNVTSGALRRFFTMIGERVERHKSTEVVLVFAGDIFEIHRSPLWFYGGDDVRPTDHHTQRLREKVTEIFESVKEENGEAGKEGEAFWPVLERFVSSGEYVTPDKQPKKLREGTDVRSYYLPGNHDRLINAWPELRQGARKLLCVSSANPADPLPNKKDFEDYRVRVRHGHEYDKANFCVEVEQDRRLRASPDEYLLPCLGDYVTVDVATRLPMAFRAMNSVGLHEAKQGRKLRKLYNSLIDFDDVRPPSLIVEYLIDRATDPEMLEQLRPALRDMVNAAISSDFFRAEAQRLGYWNGFTARVLRAAIKNCSPSKLAWIVRKIANWTREEGASAPADIARLEPGIGGAFDVVIAGHTHKPELVPLPDTGADEDDPFYINGGTWRTSIPYGKRRFGRLRDYTMVFCYSADEREAPDSDKRRFETWTGHLAAGEMRPFDEEVGDEVAPAGKMQLQFEKLVVKEIQESRRLSDAEIVLHLGVDGEGRTYANDSVKQGQTIPLAEHVDPIELDPGLDGEIWCHGREVDLGWNPFSSDDPLPWAVDRLPRQTAKNTFSQYAPGNGTLLLKGKTEHLILHYSVEARQ